MEEKTKKAQHSIGAGKNSTTIDVLERITKALGVKIVLR